MPKPAEKPLSASPPVQNFAALMEFLREPDLGLAVLSPGRFVRVLGRSEATRENAM